MQSRAEIPRENAVECQLHDVHACDWLLDAAEAPRGRELRNKKREVLVLVNDLEHGCLLLLYLLLIKDF